MCLLGGMQVTSSHSFAYFFSCNVSGRVCCQGKGGLRHVHGLAPVCALNSLHTQQNPAGRRPGAGPQCLVTWLLQLCLKVHRLPMQVLSAGPAAPSSSCQCRTQQMGVGRCSSVAAADSAEARAISGCLLLSLVGRYGRRVLVPCVCLGVPGGMLGRPPALGADCCAAAAVLGLAASPRGVILLARRGVLAAAAVDTHASMGFEPKQHGRPPVTAQPVAMLLLLRLLLLVLLYPL